MNDWISVRDRLPEDSAIVLVCDAEKKALCNARWYGNDMVAWMWNHDLVENITHWLPIPDLPEPEPPLPVCPYCGKGMKLDGGMALCGTLGLGFKCPECDQLIAVKKVLLKLDETAEEFFARNRGEG